MHDAVTYRGSLQGYDIIRVTLRDFRQIARKHERHPLNQHYFRMLTEYIQFMQTDEVFAACYNDVDGVIEDELVRVGLDPQQIFDRILEDAYLGDCEDEY